MMEVVLTRLRDFSCKTSTFDDCKPAGQSACRDSRSRTDCLDEGCTAGDEGRKLDIESALAWLRRELMEMRSQDQALIRQLMELHSGIQELKQELSEEEQEEETDKEEAEQEEKEEEGSYWDSESDRGSGSVYSGSGEVCAIIDGLFEHPSVIRPASDWLMILVYANLAGAGGRRSRTANMAAVRATDSELQNSSSEIYE